MTFITRLLTKLGIENIEKVCLPVLTKVGDFADSDPQVTRNKLDYQFQRIIDLLGIQF